tara:strand:+ start:12143 stop:12670 length:528 start_codon:yes stop_codon:yes gene_type:complete
MKIIEGIEKFILAKRTIAKPAINSLKTKIKEGNPISSFASNGASKICLKDATRNEKKTSNEAESIDQRSSGEVINKIATTQITNQLIKEKIILRTRPLPKIIEEFSESEAISLTTILCIPTSAITEANSAIANAKVYIPNLLGPIILAKYITTISLTILSEILPRKIHRELDAAL